LLSQADSPQTAAANGIKSHLSADIRWRCRMA